MKQDPRPINIEPISRESIAEKVVQRMLGLVKAGNLKANDKLPSEKELMEVFSVSRPTLREALRALSILGIITTRKGGGSYISDLSAKNILGPLEFFVSIDENNLDDIFECRRIVECQMIAKAAERVTSSQLHELQSLVNGQKEKVEDSIAFRISDQQFHGLLAEISGNAVMARIADGLYNMGMEIRRKATEIKGVLQQSILDHQAIVDALSKKDTAAAYHAMETHLQNIEKSTRCAQSGQVG